MCEIHLDPPGTCKHCKLHLIECTEGTPHGRCEGWIHVVNRAHACPYFPEYVGEPR